MVRVILKRIGLAFLTLFGVTVIVFALLQMMPGEPIDSIVPLDASEELRQVIIDQYGFDQPLYMQYFMQYFIGFAKQFQKYCQSPNINIKKDMTGFSLSPLYLSDDELTTLVTNISQIIRAVKNNEPTPKRKLRTIGIIVSPAENTEK